MRLHLSLCIMKIFLITLCETENDYLSQVDLNSLKFCEKLKEKVHLKFVVVFRNLKVDNMGRVSIISFIYQQNLLVSEMNSHPTF